MITSRCIKCSNKEHYLKSIYMSTKEIESESKLINLLSLNNELFYLKVCAQCGYTEIYSAKLVDKNSKKTTKKT
ncbi:zinc ribbon domain-containing protein [Caviibacter abscessus]|uniref:zinc ribbon domain-containing protein n=1 Tax=Caviibacter abscessus TaxID=1766719 RepID=UPI00082C422B|nr:zinc ribbon domain-containing protein [Caviibacter abscessus]